MGNYDFEADLKTAKEVEKEFAALLYKTEPGIKSIKFNNDYRYDVVVEHADRTMTYEVKNDMMSARTGNLALEYECRGKPSGISRTEADIWVYKLGNLFYTIKVEKLRDLIEHRAYFREVTGGDFGSNTKMYLFRLDLIKQFMKQMPIRKILVIKNTGA